MERFQLEEQTWALVVAGMLVSAAAVLFFLSSPNRQQVVPMYTAHQHNAMMGDRTMTPALQSKLLADKKESEFNHHLAGLFVFVAGVFSLFQDNLTKRWAVLKYGWPMSFLLLGLFLLVWSDTELWPFGHKEWLRTLQTNPEVLQHKIFALLLLGLGLIEWQRARGVLRAAWSGWVYPAVVVGGSILVLFHHHEAGMQGPDHMEVMSRIQWQHVSYAITGLSLGFVKALAETEVKSRRVLTKVWPLLMMVLGILLMGYRE